VNEKPGKFAARFAQGGKWQKLAPLYEAVDSFLYTPGTVTQSAPHVRDAMDMKRMMVTVIVALIPTVIMAFYNTGLQVNLALQRAASGKCCSPASGSKPSARAFWSPACCSR
jgi:Na+-transporting NADH:ubiquinone oxidoreductase subunit B